MIFLWHCDAVLTIISVLVGLAVGFLDTVADMLLLSRMPTKALHIALLLSAALVLRLQHWTQMLHFPLDETCPCPYFGFMSLPEADRQQFASLSDGWFDDGFLCQFLSEMHAVINICYCDGINVSP